jgi:hypothetical protein
MAFVKSYFLTLCILLNLSVAALAPLVPMVRADEFPPGKPIPPEPNIPLPPDDTVFLITPAFNIEPRLAYAPFGDTRQGSVHAIGVGAGIFLDGGRFGISVNTHFATGFDHLFAYGEVDAKGRYRIPIDSRHILWGAFGANISGRGSNDQRVDSFLRIQPAAFLGTMFAVKKKNGEVACVFQIFSKAGLGIIDNQTQSEKKSIFKDFTFDNWVRPAVGIEGLVACGSLRITTDAEHIFTIGPAGDTDRVSLEISKTFPLSPTKKNRSRWIRKSRSNL